MGYLDQVKFIETESRIVMARAGDRESGVSTELFILATLGLHC